MNNVDKIKTIYYVIPRCNTWSDRYYELLHAQIENSRILWLPNYVNYFPFLLFFWKIFLKPFPKNIIVHSNLEFAFFLSWKNEVLWTVHHDIFDKENFQHFPLYKKIYHIFFTSTYLKLGKRKAKKIFFVNEELYKTSLPKLWEKCIFIPNGIDTTEFRSTGKNPYSSDINKKILFMWKKTSRKWWDVIEKIIKKGDLKKCTFYCTTPNKESNNFKNWSQVVNLGHLTREKLISYIKYADLLLFPSRVEGFSYSIAEALACWTPVISRKDWWGFLDKSKNFYLENFLSYTRMISKIEDILYNKFRDEPCFVFDIKKTAEMYTEIYKNI